VALSPLTRSGASFRVNGQPIRLSGANAYWLGLDDNAGNSAGSFPSHSTITNALQGIKAMGANLVRAHTVGISTGLSTSFETAAGVFNDDNLDSADWAVAEAGRLGIYLMVPLTDNWNYYHGGKWNFVHWAYQQNSSGFAADTPGTTKDDPNERVFFANTAPGLRVRALFKAYISAWLNHVNPYTGLAYKDDPTLAIVETGNEVYYAAQVGSNEWTQDIASYVKSIAPGKLVADGSAADRVAVSSQPGITASAVDVLGAHYYPQTQSGSYPPAEFNATGTGYPSGTALQQLAADSVAADGAGKPFIVGEYPWTRATVNQWYSAIQNDGRIDGDLFWSFIGGTETHGGSFGSDDYPVHYPYQGSNEQTYAPALAAHIDALTPSASTAATWQVSEVSLISSSAPAASWQVSEVSISPTSTPDPISLAPIATQTVNSFDPVTITAAPANGSPTPDSYAFTLVPNADVTRLPLTGTGASRSFVAPGRMAGCDVVIRVDAISAGLVVGSTTATVHVGIHNDFVRVNGAWVAISAPRPIVVA
jgi:mannan endo-1,4-beta-mannosidase